MNKTALYIPRPGDTSQMICQGYVDTLKHLGWKVYVGDPKTKLNCKKLIEERGVRLIMTSSRYGIRQLPIKTINDNNVLVFVEALPLNVANITINDPRELAHDDEPEMVSRIESVLVHTSIERTIWDIYMQIWNKHNVHISHIPVAGNIIRALPPTCSVLTDVAMVANFSHRQGILRQLIGPLFKRLELLGYSYQAFGDDSWAKAGLNYNGPLIPFDNTLAHVYATANVCPNVHTEKQVELQACVNERSFMIPLCGGIQVSDNPLISKYLGSNCSAANSVTDFMNKVTELIENKTQRFDIIRSGVECVAHQHTYFHRLSNLFHICGLDEYALDAETKGKRAAVRHCWEIDARLSAEERGVPYEQKVIGTA